MSALRVARNIGRVADNKIEEIGNLEICMALEAMLKRQCIQDFKEKSNPIRYTV